MLGQDVVDLAQVRRLMALDESFLELLDLRVGAVDAIEADHVREQAAQLDLAHKHLYDGW